MQIDLPPTQFRRMDERLPHQPIFAPGGLWRLLLLCGLIGLLAVAKAYSVH